MKFFVILVAVMGAFSLSAEASTYEHHLLLCGNSPVQVKNAFGLSSRNSEKKYTSYFDRTDRAYYKKGVISRLRIESASKAKFDVKLRPLNPNLIPKKWLNHKDVKCEGDIYPSKRGYSCRIRQKYTTQFVKQVLKTKNYNALVSKLQRQFVQEIKKVHLDLNQAKQFGPRIVEKWDSVRIPLSLEIVYLKKSHLAELSLRDSSPNYNSNLIKIAKTKQLRICEQQSSKTVRIMNDL